jgi:hypothetical protein
MSGILIRTWVRRSSLNEKGFLFGFLTRVCQVERSAPPNINFIHKAGKFILARYLSAIISLIRSSTSEPTFVVKLRIALEPRLWNINGHPLGELVLEVMSAQDYVWA